MKAEELTRAVERQKAQVKTLTADELIREYRWYSRAYGKDGTRYSIKEVYFEIVREITRRLERFDEIERSTR